VVNAHAPQRDAASDAPRAVGVTYASSKGSRATESQNQDFALHVLEDYWIPGALYRKT